MASAPPKLGNEIGRLLALPPVDRNRLIVGLDTADRAALLLACEHELGTPFGLWSDDPVGFIELALGESLWAQQVVIARSVEANDRTAVPSCHSSGKSHGASRLVAWHLLVWPPGTAKVITTASEWRTVRNELWPHIRTIHAAHRLPGTMLQTEWQFDGNPVAYGLSPVDYDEAAFSGIHAPHLFVVVDEAGAFSPTLGRSLESLMSTPGSRMLAIGNPPFDEDRASPWFKERCESSAWNTVRIDAFDTPNLTGEDTPACRVHPDLPPHPIADHLVSREWCETQIAELGEDDPYVQARVRARFPTDLAGRVLPRSWLDEAADPAHVPEESDQVRLGIDPSGEGGDEYAIARTGHGDDVGYADGNTIRIVHTSKRHEDAHEVAGIALEQIREAERIQAKMNPSLKVRAKIDSGGLGWGVAGILEAWGREGLHSSQIVKVNFGEAANTREGKRLYRNRRSELHWGARDLAEPREGGLGPTWRLDVDDATIRQLSSVKRGYTSDGRRLVETKDQLRARGIPSPDRAEAVLLSVYEPLGTGQSTVSRPTGRLPGLGGRRMN